ncbi:MAG: CBS domain-containing protein [bacterium]
MSTIASITSHKFGQLSPLDSVDMAMEHLKAKNYRYILLKHSSMAPSIVTAENMAGYPGTRLLLDCTTMPIETVSVRQSLVNAMDIFDKSNVNLLLVTNTRGRPTGIITRNQVILSIMEEIKCERKQKKDIKRQLKFTNKLLKALNRSSGRINTIKKIVTMVKDFAKVQAVGVRLKEGCDYPYCETKGFGVEFIKSEKYLCGRNKNGEIKLDKNGDPMLECWCGNIIRGRTDAKKDYYTKGGSAWTNSTTELRTSIPQKERPYRTRNKCNSSGYESVALIPLKQNNVIIGLLQLNDKCKNIFTEEIIRFYEEIGEIIGVAFYKIQTKKEFDDLAKFSAGNPNPVARIGKDLAVIYLNPPAQKLFKDKINDAGNTVSDKYWRSQLSVAIKTNRIISHEYNFGRKTFFYIIVPVKKTGYANVYFTDITERKLMEHALEFANKQLIKAQKIASLGFLALDLKTNKMY